MPYFCDLHGVHPSVAGVILNTKVGTCRRQVMTHIGHKAGHQSLLEHCIPVHVSHVGRILDVTEAGQAALGVLGQQLQSEGKNIAVNDVSHLGERGLGRRSFTNT